MSSGARKGKQKAVVTSKLCESNGGNLRSGKFWWKLRGKLTLIWEDSGSLRGLVEVLGRKSDRISSEKGWRGNLRSVLEVSGRTMKNPQSFLDSSLSSLDSSLDSSLYSSLSSLDSSPSSLDSSPSSLDFSHSELPHSHPSLTFNTSLLSPIQKTSIETIKSFPKETFVSNPR
jgi:hypothetical protein